MQGKIHDELQGCDSTMC